MTWCEFSTILGEQRERLAGETASLQQPWTSFAAVPTVRARHGRRPANESTRSASFGHASSSRPGVVLTVGGPESAVTGS